MSLGPLRELRAGLTRLLRARERRSNGCDSRVIACVHEKERRNPFQLAEFELDGVAFAAKSWTTGLEEV